MIRDLFYDFVDLLEIVFLEPLRFPEEMKEIPLARGNSTHWAFAILSALSIATGMSLLSPPYTIGTIGFLIFGFFANLIAVRFFPFIFVIIFDYYAQGKGRNAKVSVFLSYARHSVLIFILFAPFCTVLQNLGFGGRGIGLLVLIFHLLVYSLLVGRGAKYIYDLKDKDAFKFGYTALGLSILFPLLFNLYTATTILQSLAGDF
ncbi:hypothetical protein LPTSP3_g03840 [Leptospira kobayashii]|uniref:Yip1 domain-containing protein n=1 Tax=Leptospira kobayashii TaxID=1917830 RepID=A0ABN6KB21_9LEPT|nr:hypothetical protein [Leptospira kobayashii]BDA77454.1 hypothetical protein LPTSP3_g03840 [Leptospira kobayashii]